MTEIPEREENRHALLGALGRGSALVLGSQLFSRAVALGLQLLLGRLLGVAGYGLYGTVVAWMEILSRIGELGMGSSLVRFMERERVARHSNVATFSGALLVGTVASLLAGAILFLSAPRIAQAYASDSVKMLIALRIASFGVPVYALFSLVTSAMRAIDSPGMFAGVAAIRSLLAAGLAGILAIIGLGVAGSVGGFIGGTLGALLLASVRLRTNLRLTRVCPPRRETVVRLLRFGVPLYIAGFSLLLLTRVNLIILGSLRGAVSAGEFRAAIALSSLVVAGPSAINLVLAPILARQFRAEDLTGIRDAYISATRWSTALALLLGAPIIVFSRTLLSVFGAEFSGAASALMVLGGFQLINAGVGSVGFVLQMRGNQDIVLINNVVSVGINIALCYLLIPSFGTTGAAIACGTALALKNVLGLLEVWWLTRLHPFNAAYVRLACPPFIAWACLLGARSFLRMGSIAEIGVFCLALGLSMIGFVTREDRALLRSFARTLRT